MTTRSVHNDSTLARNDHPFFARIDEKVVTADLEIQQRQPCERILLPRRLGPGEPVRPIHLYIPCDLEYDRNRWPGTFHEGKR